MRGSEASAMLRAYASRIRWSRVLVMATIPVSIMVATAVFPPSAESHELYSASFYGPLPLVGYSLTEVQEKARIAEEREREMQTRTLGADDGDVPAGGTYLRSGDDRYQHEEDFDFRKANRDNVIARAVRGWTPPTWMRKIDWDAVAEKLGVDSPRDPSAGDLEADGQTDPIIEGYDDIVCASFSDDISMAWVLPNDGGNVTCDSSGKVEGTASVCPNFDETVTSSTRSLYVLDKGTRGDVDTITFAMDDGEYAQMSISDRAVPDTENGRLVRASAMGRDLREMTVDRRQGIASARRDDFEGDIQKALSIRVSVLHPTGRSFYESVSAIVRADTKSQVSVRVTGFDVVVSTEDESGLAGVQVEIEHHNGLAEHVETHELDTTDKSVSFPIGDIDGD